jgi:Fic family protein
VGESTFFIEFMLEIILDSLESLLKTQNVALTNSDRIEIFKTLIKDEYFTRKDYLRNFKKISQATASRDLQFAVENKILKKFGDKNTTKYKFLKKANKA